MKIAIVVALFVSYCLQLAFGQECQLKGECVYSNFIASSVTVGEKACLSFCKKTSGCKWFTFHPDNLVCLAYSDCNELSTENCDDCISGQASCIYEDNNCFIQGICSGTLIDEESTQTFEDCKTTCRTTKNCQWFSFDGFSLACYLFMDCLAIDSKKTTCTSSSLNCSATTSFTKLLVATGYGGSYLDSVEVIDLETSASTCQPFPDYPKSISGAFGGLFESTVPIICGGHDISTTIKNCYKYSDQAWVSINSLITARGYGSGSFSPFPKLPHTLFFIGGDGAESTAEYFYDDRWVSLTSPTAYFHCSVMINSTSVMVIGGAQETSYSRTVNIFNPLEGKWELGSPISTGRNFHSCGRIRKDKDSNEFTFIVVGGNDGSLLSSTEIYDQSLDLWRNGPDLPMPIESAKLTEDADGGVILVGGYNGNYLQTLYRLSDASSEAKWIELPQKLQLARRQQVAFLIPDHLVNCTMGD